MADLDYDPVPSYREFATQLYDKVSVYLETFDSDFLTYPARFYADIQRFSKITQNDVLVVLGFAVLLTVLRYLLTKFVFRPWGQWIRMTPVNIGKFPESGFKLMFYSTTWCWSFYLIIISGRYEFFNKPLRLWEGFKIHQEIPMDIYIIYTLQIAFYIHSIYGTIYMDHWRKDSLVMIFHHFLTILLLSFSYAIKCHNVGMLILFLLDISDVCLEFSKCNVYLKNRNNSFHAINDHLSTIGFLGFSTTWFVCRLYWFPLKALMSAGVAVVDYFGYVPFYLFFNVLLWILQVLHVYWFMFIVQFLFKVATGQIREVDDVRENDVTENLGKKEVNDNHDKGHGDVVTNGAVHHQNDKKQK